MTVKNVIFEVVKVKYSKLKIRVVKIPRYTIMINKLFVKSKEKRKVGNEEERKEGVSKVNKVLWRSA